MAGVDGSVVVTARSEDREFVVAPREHWPSSYEWQAALGVGGASALHLARHRRTGEVVVLKQLRAGSDADARLAREVAAHRRLAHAHLVPLLDAGHAGGNGFLVFAYVPGIDLAGYLDRHGALPADTARRVMLQVLDALACAHAAGVVHRDVKPSNILIVADDSRLDARLLDFGSCALAESAGGAGDRCRLIVGTPGYAAPEQWRGAEPAARADLFSWALTFVECLTGERVFAGPEAGILYRLLGPDPVPLPRWLATHPLGAMLAVALNKEPAARAVTAAGLADAVRACPLEGLAPPTAAPFSPTVVPALAACEPLVGRGDELAQLLDGWARARTGAGGAHFVVGEPGIGKSRLVRALRERVASEAAAILETRCAPDMQHAPLAPIVPLLERVLGVVRTAPPEVRLAQLERGLAAYPRSAGAFAILALLLELPIRPPHEVPDVSPARRKALMLQAVAACLVAQAARGPMLVWIEDLHWADPTTLEFLAQLVRDAPEAAIYIVLTTRPTMTVAFTTLTVGTVPLGRLSHADGDRMLRALARKPLPDAVTEHVLARADGVPLFIEELFQMLLDTALVLERPQRYELAGRLEDAVMPQTLQALLTARVDSLGSARNTAQLAAVLGREFELEVLAAVAALGAALDATLDQLTRAGVMFRQRRGDVVLGVFKHALLRDAAYESIEPVERRELHARIAAAYERRFPEIARARPDLLAHHHAAAAQPTQAVAYALRAAEHELARSAYAEAIAQASCVVTWSHDIPGPRAAVVELEANGILIQALMAARGWTSTDVKATADRSVHLLATIADDSERRVQLLWSLFTYYHVASNRRAARAAAEELNSLVARSADVGLQAAAAMLYGLTLFSEGDHGGARLAFGRAHELYDPARDRDHGARFGLDTLVIVRAYVAHLQWFEGASQKAFATTADAVAWARELRHIPSLAVGLLYSSTLHQRAGDRRAVIAMTEEILYLHGRHGLPAYERYAQILHAWACGDAAHVRAVIDRLIHLGCRLGLPYYQALAAEIDAEHDALDRALATVDQCLALCDASDERFFAPELHLRRARYAAAAGAETSSIVASLSRAAALSRRQAMPRVEALAIVELARRVPQATPWLARLDELARASPGVRAVVNAVPLAGATR
jgi:hypothetical protein